MNYRADLILASKQGKRRDFYTYYLLLLYQTFLSLCYIRKII